MPPCNWQASAEAALVQQAHSRDAAVRRAADRDDGSRSVEPQAGDARIKLADRHVDRAGDVPGVPLGQRAHVDELRRGGAIEQHAIELPR